MAAWSPDGKTIGIVSEGTLDLVPVGAGQAVTIARNGLFGEQVGGLAWSADSRIIYHCEIASDGTNSLWAAPVTGENPKLLLHLTDPLRQLYRQWIAADSRHIFFTIGSRESDVWVMELTRK